MVFDTDKIASTLLGKKIEGTEYYNPSFLVAIPRIENRKQYNISNENLPFEGYDIWHAYEFSTMTDNGIPITRLMKIRYNCNSPYLIESKSLKLYLNSFNMCKNEASIDDCLIKNKSIIEKDLSNVLQTQVEINFLDNNLKRVNIFEGFTNLLELFDYKKINIQNFKENPSILQIENTGITKQYYLTYDSLRSNCRVTHQPDFGDAFIYYKSKIHIKEECLFEYLTSFRSEYHFHEECCEMIYKRLADILEKDDELFVCCLYTRRGGIDICPVRYSKNCNYKDVDSLLNLTKYARNGVKQ